MKLQLDLIGFRELPLAKVYSNTTQTQRFLIITGGERVRSGDRMTNQAVTVCSEVNNAVKTTNLYINNAHINSQYPEPAGSKFQNKHL